MSDGQCYEAAKLIIVGHRDADPFDLETNQAIDEVYQIMLPIWDQDIDVIVDAVHEQFYNWDPDVPRHETEDAIRTALL